MAASSLDVSSLTSSDEVFSSSHTLPYIRGIHRSLYTAVDDKATRLRSQVGSSYRDLLGTADSIVQMRTDNDAVQGLLGRMGGRCGRAVIVKKVSSLGSFVKSGDTNKDFGDIATVARAKLLERCGLVVGRVLRGSPNSASTKLSKGHRLLIASKVFVLSRLLVKSFGDRCALSIDTRMVVETAEHNLKALRRRLLKSISTLLAQSVEVDTHGDVVGALCAYSLVTSSGARDVLRHFLRVRGDAISGTFDAEENGRPRTSNDVLKSWKLYTTTLLDVQALVPSKLSNALALLKKTALLADETLVALEGLRLDAYQRWCSDEIQFYAPFIRHDDLDGPLARTMLAHWAETGAEVLIDGLKTTMERMTELQSIMDLRTAVLQLWIRDGGKAKGFDPSEMLDSLRAAINGHMLQVLEMKVDKLHLVASEVSATLDAWQVGVTDQQESLWADRDFDADITLGADRFLQDLVARLHGRNDAVSRAINCFNSWKQVIDEVGNAVEQLKSQRWDNDIDEIEDEDTIESRQQLLSKDDPKTLQAKLDTSLEAGFRELDIKLASLWANHSATTDPSIGRMAVYIIRLLRDVRAGMPKLESAAMRQFGLSIVPSLHGKLVTMVASTPVEIFTSTVLMQKPVIGRTLWEGTPELPMQPSPSTFRFLRNVSQAMGDAGMDLWSPEAVAAAKKHITQESCKAWLKAVDTLLGKDLEPPLALGAEPPSKQQRESSDELIPKDEGEGVPPPEFVGSVESLSNQQKQDLLTQWLFDINILRLALEVFSAKGQGGFADLEELVYVNTGLDSDEARNRMVKSAQTYWQKSNLLFGLLVASSSY